MIAFVREHADVESVGFSKVAQAVKILPSAASFGCDKLTHRPRFVSSDGREATELDLIIFEICLAQPKIRNDRHKHGVRKDNR